MIEPSAGSRRARTRSSRTTATRTPWTRGQGRLQGRSEGAHQEGGVGAVEGPEAGPRHRLDRSRLARRARRLQGGNSFTGTTAVLMADGSPKATEDIEVGDRVRATDPETGKTVNRTVEDVIAGFGIKRLVKVTAGGRTITATAVHPFWVESRGKWVDAEDLRIGDVVRDVRGALKPVTALSVRELGDQRVYNLTVAGVHTFHVGTARLLVH